MATAEELILLVVSIAGLGFGAFGVYDAWHDMRVLKLENGRRIVARSNLRAQSFRTTKLALFVLAGLVSALSSSPMSDGGRLVVVLCLILIAGITTLDAVMDRLARRRILQHYRVPEEPLKVKIVNGENTP